MSAFKTRYFYSDRQHVKHTREDARSGFLEQEIKPVFVFFQLG
jgi:hypothetical protein